MLTSSSLLLLLSSTYIISTYSPLVGIVLVNATPTPSTQVISTATSIVNYNSTTTDALTADQDEPLMRQKLKEESISNPSSSSASIPSVSDIIKPADFDLMRLLILSVPPEESRLGCTHFQWVTVYAKMLESAFKQNIPVYMSVDMDSLPDCENTFRKVIRDYDTLKSKYLQIHFQNYYDRLEPIRKVRDNDNHDKNSNGDGNDNNKNDDENFSVVNHYKTEYPYWRNPWVRDYGHNFVYNKTSLEFQFAVPNYDNLDCNPDDPYMACYSTHHFLKLKSVAMDVMLEFGNLISNGRGTCIVSDKIYQGTLKYWHETEFPMLKFSILNFRSFIRQELKTQLGCEKLVVLEQLKKEITGHVDMYMFLLSPSELVYFKYSTQQDSDNAKIMENNLQLLKKQFIVHIFEMPSRRTEKNKEIFYSYANVIQINSDLFIPSYLEIMNSLEEQERFRKIQVGLQELLNTNRFRAKQVKVIGRTDSLIKYLGNIHCLTASLNVVPEMGMKEPKELIDRFQNTNDDDILSGDEY